MATVRKTITLTDQQDGWFKSQIDAGYYTNDSEFIRDLIRRDQEHSADRLQLATLDCLQDFLQHVHDTEVHGLVGLVYEA